MDHLRVDAQHAEPGTELHRASGAGARDRRRAGRPHRLGFLALQPSRELGLGDAVEPRRATAPVAVRDLHHAHAGDASAGGPEVAHGCPEPQRDRHRGRPGPRRSPEVGLDAFVEEERHHVADRRRARLLRQLAEILSMCAPHPATLTTTSPLGERAVPPASRRAVSGVRCGPAGRRSTWCGG